MFKGVTDEIDCIVPCIWDILLHICIGTELDVLKKECSSLVCINT